MATHIKYCISVIILLLQNGPMLPVLADDTIVGSPENDILVGSAKDDIIRGEFGNDIITGKNGDDDIFGNSGNDTINAGNGDDGIYPGPGVDYVSAGKGDDQVTIYDICEIKSGEILDGGKGSDILAIPVDLATVQLLGATVINIEEIRVESSNRCLSDCTIPCSREPIGLGDLPDPEIWSKDAASGLRFRPMTRAEREANGFAAGTYFIETAPGLIEELISGKKPSSLLIIPTADSRVYPMQLGTPILIAKGNVTKLQRNLVPGISNELVTTTTKPVVYEYIVEGSEYEYPTSVEDAIVSILVGSGIYGSGLVGKWEVRIRGTNRASQWLVESIPYEGLPIMEQDLLVVSNLELGEYGAAQAIACHDGDCTWICANTGTTCGSIPDTPLVVTSCNDMLDNDADGGIDKPGDEECAGHPANCSVPDPDLRNACWGTDTAPFFITSWESGKSYGLFGEGSFCSLHPESWFEEMLNLARDAQHLINLTRGNIILPNGLPPFGFEMKVRFVAGGCWIFPGQTIAERVDAADTCNQTGDCGDIAGFNSYPYRAAGDLSKGYYGRVWDDVHHGATLLSGGLRDVLHMAQVLYNGEMTTDIDCQKDGIRVSCCGEHLGSKNYSSVPINFRGAGFTKVSEDGCVPAKYTIAHEMGHAMGLEHDTEGIGVFPGFMNMAGGSEAIIKESNRTQMITCLEDWECPRPSGFRYSVDNCPACP